MSIVFPKLSPKVAAAAQEIDALQKGFTFKKSEERIRDIFMGMRGKDLSELKRAVDLGGNPRDLVRLIDSDIDSSTIRNQIEAHITKEGQALGQSGRVKVFSDIDDTLYCNWVDKRFPKGTMYPGVRQFYQELDRGVDESDAPGDLVFLTARPGERIGFIEQGTHDMLATKEIGQAAVLSGDFFSWITNQRIANKKVENFDRMMKLYPEYGAVFIGDSGQGDHLAAVEMMKRKGTRATFIHNIGNMNAAQQADYAKKGVVMFDSYVGAALAAYERGLISKAGLTRVAIAAKQELDGIKFTSTEQERAARAAQHKALQEVALIV